MVARLSVRPCEECSLIGDTEAGLALLLIVLVALQVSVLHHLHLLSHVFRASAIADVEPVITAGPFQLAQPEFARLDSTRLPSLASRVSKWNARTGANQVELPTAGSGIFSVGLGQ